MTQPDDNAKDNTPEKSEPDPLNLQDLVGGLDFVPNWAKEGGTPRPSYEDRGDDDRRRRPSGRDRDRDRGRGPRPGGSRPGGSHPGARRPDDKRREGGHKDRPFKGRPDRRDDDRSRDRGRPRDDVPRLPVEISFIPERDRLGAVVKQLHIVKRAFPMTYVAGLFLKKPEYHLLKIEAKPAQGEEPLQFHQDKKSRMVFLSEAELTDHVVRVHLDDHFQRVELSVEPPAGNFVCVGRCKRSGVLLGPPNYHGYNERLLELHRARFAGVPFDVYRNSIEMVRDPAVVEQWKESCRVQYRYRPKATPEAEATLTLAQAERQFLEQFAAEYMQSGPRVILPAALVDRIHDRRLVATIHSARLREDRFPLSLMLALRPAFRRMRLHLFKAGKNETYVTPIPPKPMDAEHAIPEIRGIVSVITEHPGCTQKQLVEKLFPGRSADEPEVAEKLSPLVWLIDKGHIIEFFNGTFAIPGHLRNPGVAPSEAPQEHHHEGAEARVAATAFIPEAEAPAPATAPNGDGSLAPPVGIDDAAAPMVGENAAEIPAETLAPAAGNEPAAMPAESPVDQPAPDGPGEAAGEPAADADQPRVD